MWQNFVSTTHLSYFILKQKKQGLGQYVFFFLLKICVWSFNSQSVSQLFEKKICILHHHMFDSLFFFSFRFFYGTWYGWLLTRGDKLHSLYFFRNFIIFFLIFFFSLIHFVGTNIHKWYKKKKKKTKTILIVRMP